MYDNLDPLVALGAAARTERIELMTTVLNVNYRRNAVVLAKQLASVDHLSGGRLTAALGMGGWPQDHDASDLAMAGRGAPFDAMLDTMRRVWDGEIGPDHLDLASTSSSAMPSSPYLPALTSWPHPASP